MLKLSPARTFFLEADERLVGGGAYLPREFGAGVGEAYSVWNTIGPYFGSKYDWRMPSHADQ